MADPFKNMMAVQMAWFEAMSAMFNQSMRCWQHMAQMQQTVLTHNPAAEHLRSHVEIAQGASFTDKYGKRAHDIDPERDV